MNSKLLLLWVLGLIFILCSGCVDQPEITSVKGDVSVESISFPQQQPPVLGSKYIIKVETKSTNEKIPYRVDIKVGGEKILTYIATGNTTKELEIPASKDGLFNITAIASFANSSYMDTNVSNDFKTMQLKILPYGNYTNVVKSTTKVSYYECNTSSTYYCKKEEVFYEVDNYTSIFERRTYGLLLHFDVDTEIFSIGIFPRKNIILSPNATLNYTIYPVVNNTPSNKSVMMFSTSLLNIGNDWGGIAILRRKTLEGKLPAGDYVLEISVSEGSYVDIACFPTQHNNTTFTRASPSPKKQWYPGPNCTANVIISSRNELETYKEYMAANKMEEYKPA